MNQKTISYQDYLRIVGMSNLIHKKTKSQPSFVVPVPTPPPIPIPNIPFYGILAGLGNMKEYDLSKNNGLRWPFECWGDNGQVYLHGYNWEIFKQKIEKEGCWRHNWLHHRLGMSLYHPCKYVQDFCHFLHLDYISLKYVQDDWSVVYEPYPVHQRTVDDPDGREPSWHVWVENKHTKPTYGEPVVLMSTGKHMQDDKGRHFAYFKERYWLVTDYRDYGIGSHEPPAEEVKRLNDPRNKKSKYRSIDDE